LIYIRSSARFIPGRKTKAFSNYPRPHHCTFYDLTVVVIWMLMIASIKLYGIDRSKHEENLRKPALQQE